MNARFLWMLVFLVGFHLLKSQVPSNTYAKPSFIANSLSQHKASPYSDSLAGFDEQKWLEIVKAKGVMEPERSHYIAFEKRRYIRSKYGFDKNQFGNHGSGVQGKFNPGTIFTATPCLNEGFENTAVGTYTGAANANAISGWSISSVVISGTNTACNATGFTPGSPEFSIVSTPLFNVPSLGNVLTSPLGGTNIAHINEYTNNNTLTRLSTNFPVTNSNSMFFYAFAAVFLSGTHQCCDDAGFRFNVYDCNNNIVPCLSKAISPSCSSESGFYNSGAGYVSNWQVRSINLTPYVGSCVTIEFIVHDCCYGGHYGTVFLDAACGTPSMSLVYNPFSPGTVGSSGVSYCQGSNFAQISGPPGYNSYNWIAPVGSPSISPAQASLAVLGINNPVANAVYTLNYAITNASNTACTYTTTFALIPTTISLGTLNVSPTCSGGSSGSGTVLANGSSMGYTYNWVNLLNQSVGTGSVVGSLSSGIYTVTASVPNFSSCGTATTTLFVPVGPPTPTYVSKPFCSNVTSSITLTHTLGTNYLWYALPSVSIINTSASVTVSGFTNSTQYALGYNHLGCRDSIVYTMVNSVPGLLTANSASPGCPGTNTGALNIQFQPNLTNGNGPFTYSLVALSNSTSVYTNTVLSTSVFNTQVNNLAIPGAYTLTVNDGICVASALINLSSIVPNFTLSPSPSNATLCAGSSLSASVVVNNTVSNSNYSYTWSPTLFLAPNSSTLPNVNISPSVTSAYSVSQIYTVMVSPLNSACVKTTTIKVTLYDLANASVNPVPIICSKSPQYTVTGSPLGGQFISTNPGISNGGIITPSLTILGANTATYYIQQYSCTASVPFTYSYYITPTVGILGPSLICAGDAVVLNATGANSYTWSTAQNGPTILISPNQNTTYTVTGSSVQGCKSTATLSVKLNPCLSLEKNSGISLFTVYPNPVLAQLTIFSQTSANLSIFDAQGKMVFASKLEEGENFVDMKTWSEGLYTYEAISDRGKETGKILKAK